MNVDTGTLANIASVIAAFGAAMLFFRIQRELEMVGKGQRVWLPWADRLLIAATLLCLLFVILPLLSTTTTSLPAAAAAAAAVLVAGYVFALLAHYRIVFGGRREGPRTNPEPAERFIVIVTAIAASALFVWRILL